MAQMSKASLRRSGQGRSSSSRIACLLLLVGSVAIAYFALMATSDANGEGDPSAKAALQDLKGKLRNKYTQLRDSRQHQQVPDGQLRSPDTETVDGEPPKQQQQEGLEPEIKPDEVQKQPAEHTAILEHRGDVDNNNNNNDNKDIEESGDERPRLGEPKLPDSFAIENAVAVQGDEEDNESPQVGMIGDGGRETYLYHHYEKGRAPEVLEKMIMAHATTFVRGAIFGGSCAGEDINRDKQVKLLEALGLVDVLPLACPRDRAWDMHSRRREIAPREVERDGYRIFTPEYVEYLLTRVKYPEKSPDEPYTIVVHLRRKGMKPCSKLRKGYLRYLPNTHYQALIDAYMQPGAKVIIYSQSKSFESLDDFTNRGYEMHIDGAEDEVWRALANADVAILSRSTFSSVPAIVNKGIVVYTKFWREPLKQWHVVGKEIMESTEKETARLREFC